MPSVAPDVEQVHGFCALCVSRCGSIATIQDGRFVGLDADPDHPTGKAFCIKGRAAPELVYHPERLLYPMRRTRPKEDADPGWQRISWDEAIATTAERLRRRSTPSAARRPCDLMRAKSAWWDDDASALKHVLPLFMPRDLRLGKGA